jgi:hypothetical protein
VQVGQVLVNNKQIENRASCTVGLESSMEKGFWMDIWAHEASKSRSSVSLQCMCYHTNPVIIIDSGTINLDQCIEVSNLLYFHPAPSTCVNLLV